MTVPPSACTIDWALPAFYCLVVHGTTNIVIDVRNPLGVSDCSYYVPGAFTNLDATRLIRGCYFRSNKTTPALGSPLKPFRFCHDSPVIGQHVVLMSSQLVIEDLNTAFTERLPPLHTNFITTSSLRHLVRARCLSGNRRDSHGSHATHQYS